ncbi:AMP-binding protein [Thiotrichales bacterium 19S9-12]|nr:AMP-binding protein [Thiotrichales bacterium 19S9-11]MCF6811761.1 AMP-binding protein [Thiotrichales bacterium 19S9-12]
MGDHMTYLAKWMKELNLKSVAAFHHFSVTEKEAFWLKVINQLKIPFKKSYSQLMDISDPIHPKWLPDAKANFIDCCLNHNANKIAIIYVDQNNKIEKLTYDQLKRMVDRIAHSLIRSGFKKGDRLAIDMTMTKEAVAIYLGVIKAGLSVVSIADSFAVDEIKVRLDITDAKAIFTEDYILRNNKAIPLYDKVKQADPQKVIVIKNSNIETSLRENDQWFDDFLVDNDAPFESIPLSFDDEINVLFSSGTTGEPKAIPWTQATLIKVYSDSLLHFDTNESDTWAWPTNLGWMMGPWVTFSSFLHGATLALYDNAPTTLEFAQFMTQARVTKLGVVPSIVSALRNNKVLEDPSVNWQDIKAFGSTGECSSFDDMRYLSQRANNAPVIEYCGGTEIGGAYITSTLVEPFKLSTFSTPAFGLDFCLLDDNQNIIEGEAEGEVAIIGPSFGLSLSLLNKDHDAVYYRGMPTFNGVTLRRHGDEIARFKNDFGFYYRAQGRADDTMNLGGIKTSSAEIERCVNKLDAVYESAAISVNGDKGGPAKLVIFMVLNNKSEKKDLKKQAQQVIKEKLNPLFKLSDVVIIDQLPRTASNKVMRRKLRDGYQSI